MSLLTRCPACTTLYRVVPDQLRISEGWVKCGQCGDIFDASQHLIEATIDPAPPSGVEVDAPLTVDLSVAPSDGNQLPDDAPTSDFETALGGQSLPVSSLGSGQDQGKDQNQDPDHGSGLGSDPHQAAGLNLGSAVPDQADLDVNAPSEQSSDPVLALESETAELRPNSDQKPDHDPDSAPESYAFQVQREDDAPVDSAIAPGDAFPDVAAVTFLQADKRQALWHKPLVRAALVLLSLVLGLLLAGQWVYFSRDRLAAQQPDLKPLLQTFCSVANCEIQAFQRIEALSVDSVGFNQLGQDIYRLSFVVKNASTLPLAMPAVELALTDSQDLPVYRRVFSSKDLGAANAEIVAGAEWTGRAVLRVTPGASGELVRGYRLLVFYP